VHITRGSLPPHAGRFLGDEVETSGIDTSELVEQGPFCVDVRAFHCDQHARLRPKSAPEISWKLKLTKALPKTTKARMIWAETLKNVLFVV
jgi:hypothetical protein